METLPVLRSKLAHHPIVAGKGQNHEDRQSSESEPNEGFRKAGEQIVHASLIQNVAREMEQAVDTGRDADVAAMAIESVHDPGLGKQHTQRSQRQHRSERPDRNLARRMQKPLQRVSTKSTRECRNKEK